MLKNLKQTFIHLKLNLYTIMMFEVIHKFIGFFILLPVMGFLFQKSLDIRALTYLDLNVLKTYFLHPESFIFTVIAGFLFFTWLTIEYLFLVNCYKEQSQSVLVNFKRTKRYIYESWVMNKFQFIKNILAYLIVFMVIYMIMVYANYTIFALAFELINQSALLKWIIVLGVVAIFWWTSKWIFLTSNVANPDVRSQKARKKQQRITSIKTLLFNSSLMLLIGALFWIITFLTTCGLFIVKQHINYTIVLGMKTLLRHIYSGLVFVLVPPLIISFMSALTHISKNSEVMNQHVLSLNASLNVKARKRTGVTLLLFIMLYLASLIYDSRAFFYSDSNTNVKMPLAIAHRGTSIWAPGNSSASISEALEMNADFIEIDVQVTRDGIPVLFHDAYLSNQNTDSDVFNLSGKKISDVTYEELKSLTLSTYFPDSYQEKIMTLSQTLGMMDEKSGAMIEIKTDNRGEIEKILQVIKESNFKSDIYISSFDIETLKFFKHSSLPCETNLLLTGFVGDIDQILSRDDVDAMAFEYAAIDSVLVEKIHHVNKKIFVWTINDEARIVRSIVTGVDGIITDLPSLVTDFPTYITENIYFPRKSEFFQLFDVLSK